MENGSATNGGKLAPECGNEEKELRIKDGRLNPVVSEIELERERSDARPGCTAHKPPKQASRCFISGLGEQHFLFGGHGNGRTGWDLLRFSPHNFFFSPALALLFYLFCAIYSP
jgi:hypothetical protein